MLISYQHNAHYAMTPQTKGKTMSQYSFASVPQANISRSKFDLSHVYKTAINGGYLYPILVCDVLPGDTMTLTTSMVARLSTPLLPVMDNIHIDTFFFYVPSRLVWNNLEKFFGEQENPGDSIDFIEPSLNFSVPPQEESIFDYCGIPPKISLSAEDYPSALPLRAMNLIYNEWFRDEDLQDSLEVRKDDGPDPLNLYKLFKRNKRKDYFTSARPWPQKGPAVTIGLGDRAPVAGTGLALGLTNGEVQYGLASTNSSKSLTGAIGSEGLGVGASRVGSLIDDNVVLGVTQDPEYSGLYADLSLATASSILDLRKSFALQSFLERLAVTGSRYTEYLHGIWGVQAPDARLQRPEFLGGSSEYMNLQQVAQTSQTTDASPQGHLSAFGYSSSVNHGFQKSFVEHGFVIGFVNVWVDITYQQGLQRFWSRKTQYDYANPYLAHIGEQAILNKEIYLDSSSIQNNEVFGYAERFAEYRYFPSLITGKMRSTSNTPLDAWHLAQKFDSLPTLSSQFIEENPPLDRILAVTDEPEIFLDCFFDMKAVRPLPLYGTPGIGKHL